MSDNNDAKNGDALVIIGAPFIRGNITVERNQIMGTSNVSIVSTGEIRHTKHKYVYVGFTAGPKGRYIIRKPRAKTTSSRPNWSEEVLEKYKSFRKSRSTRFPIRQRRQIIKKVR